MKKTIITIQFNTTESKNKWWPKALCVVCDSQKWDPIITKNLFVIASAVGSICLTPYFYETTLVCTLQEWVDVYKSEVEEIVKSIDPQAVIKEREAKALL